ncbi:MAG: SDR family oxidoreductase [Trueperaceae bacterium]
MDLGLQGKRALVTAASGGLGYAVAEALAAEGARVALCSRDAGRAAAAAERIAASTGADVHAIEADVADPASLEALFEAALRALGGLDVLVNNAGGPPPGGFLDLDETQWARGFELTLMSAVRGIRLALPSFAAAGGGRVLTIMSSSVKQALPNLLLSNVYRPALVGLTKSLAIELGPRNVQVVGIAPGRIATQRTDELDRAAAARAGRSFDAVRADSLASMPAGRLGHPAEFGRVGAFLCSSAAAYVSGSVVLVDGGSTRAL